jgi:hypothetical protein
MVLVKPATVTQWHREGFRLIGGGNQHHAPWGGPKVSPETRDLIRQMSMVNPLWGAPRILGELLKLGVEVGQATVGRYMPWRPKDPSPGWRTFLQNPCFAQNSERPRKVGDFCATALPTHEQASARIIIGRPIPTPNTFLSKNKVMSSTRLAYLSPIVGDIPPRIDSHHRFSCDRAAAVAGPRVDRIVAGR